METVKSPKVIALIMTVLFFGTLFWMLNTQRVNSVLADDLNSEKLKSETMLSEKLLLQKEIDKLKDQLTSLSGKNAELDKVVSATSSKLAAQELAYNKLAKENSSLKQIKKQRDDLASLNKDLNAQLENLNSTIARLKQENEDMSSTVASLQQRNKLLNEELHKAMLASVDYTQVQSLKGTKLTAKARQTKKLVANFEVPTELKNLTFKITDPSGNVIPASEGTIASRVVGEGRAYTASSAEGSTANTSSKVEMTYIPAKKLKQGVYKIEILNDNLYVGSLQVKLR